MILKIRSMSLSISWKKKEPQWFIQRYWEKKKTWISKSSHSISDHKYPRKELPKTAQNIPSMSMFSSNSIRSSYYVNDEKKRRRRRWISLICFLECLGNEKNNRWHFLHTCFSNWIIVISIEIYIYDFFFFSRLKKWNLKVCSSRETVEEMFVSFCSINWEKKSCLW